MGQLATNLDAFVAATHTAEPTSGGSPALEAVTALCAGAGGAIKQAFRMIGIAEERMAAFQARHPDKAKPISDAFLALRWLYEPSVPDVVYRAHVDELLKRAVQGESLSGGTRAEALWTMYKTNLDAPLTAQGQSVMEHLFEHIVGKTVVFGEPAPEPWPGAREEMLGMLLRRLRRNREEG